MKEKEFRLYWKKGEGRKEIQFGDVPYLLLWMLKHMIVNLETSITRKNPLKESGYGCKGLGKLDVELM